MPKATPPALSFRVRISFPTTSPRTNPIGWGYYPACWWEGEVDGGWRHYHDAKHQIPWDAPLEKGESTETILVPVEPKYWGAVGVGTVIELCEGPLVVATAEVLEVLNPVPREA